MDEATRRHWEQLADRCFDRAYRAAQRAVTTTPIKDQMLGRRAKSEPSDGQPAADQRQEPLRASTPARSGK